MIMADDVSQCEKRATLPTEGLAEYLKYSGNAAAGSAAGLVWTSVGGAVQYVECCCVGRGQAERQGRLMLTGQVHSIPICMLFTSAPSAPALQIFQLNFSNDPEV